MLVAYHLTLRARPIYKLDLNVGEEEVDIYIYFFTTAKGSSKPRARVGSAVALPPELPVNKLGITSGRAQSKIDKSVDNLWITGVKVGMRPGVICRVRSRNSAAG
jgi:hypothetical protein